MSKTSSVASISKSKLSSVWVIDYVDAKIESISFCNYFGFCIFLEVWTGCNNSINCFTFELSFFFFVTRSSGNLWTPEIAWFDGLRCSIEIFRSRDFVSWREVCWNSSVIVGYWRTATWVAYAYELNLLKELVLLYFKGLKCFREELF